MTAQILPIPEASEEIGVRPDVRSTSLPAVWLSTLAVFFSPVRMGKRWLRVSLVQASVVGAVNLLLAPLWFYVISVVVALWSGNNGHALVKLAPGGGVQAPNWDEVALASTAVLRGWSRTIAEVSPVDKIAGVMALVFGIVAAFLVPFFLLLPFAARPGRNKPCVRHVARTVLLSTSALHYWGIALVAVFAALIFTTKTRTDYLMEYLRALTPVILTAMSLLLWHLASAIAAARQEYRGPEDYPEPHEPWCDNCGYNLIAAPDDGRCPECGRPVADCLGPHTRPPTPWEQNPTPANTAALRCQLKQIVRHPRDLFFSMPTLTGQAAAQRWLVLSIVAVGIAATPLVPIAARLRDAEWSIDILSGAAAMGLVWALLALMMVGIETAGIATFSKMKAKKSGLGRGVYLATAAKVTSYSSTLMLWWVLLGGIQLLGTIYWADSFFLGHVRLAVRTQQVILALTLSAAHIGGLLWYELTVYRGIRAVQFANK